MSRFPRRLVACTSLCVSFLVGGCGDTKDPSSPWTRTGSMARARVGHRLTSLPSGKVLVTGIDIYDSASATGACEQYDERSGAWTPTGSLSTSRSFHAAVALPSGKVLVAGGQHDIFLGSQAYLSSAEVFDEAAGTWSATGSMAAPRATLGAVLLASGQVLLAGGETTAGANVDTVEIYDPVTGTFSPAAPLAQARRFHAMIRLPSGEVLVAGGCTSADCAATTATAELFDPVAGTWSAAAPLPVSRMFLAATLLQGGKVLVVGGAAQEPDYVPTAGAYVYDPAADAWTSVAPMACPRWLPVMRTLSTGKVLVAGGTLNAPAECATSTEVYDPVANTWTPGAAMAANHGSALESASLPSGAWLVAGGVRAASSEWVSVADAEVFAE